MRGVGAGGTTRSRRYHGSVPQARRRSSRLHVSGRVHRFRRDDEPFRLLRLGPRLCTRHVLGYDRRPQSRHFLDEAEAPTVPRIGGARMYNARTSVRHLEDVWLRSCVLSLDRRQLPMTPILKILLTHLQGEENS